MKFPRHEPFSHLGSRISRLASRPLTPRGAGAHPSSGVGSHGETCSEEEPAVTGVALAAAYVGLGAVVGGAIAWLAAPPRHRTMTLEFERRLAAATAPPGERDH